MDSVYVGLAVVLEGEGLLEVEGLLEMEGLLVMEGLSEGEGLLVMEEDRVDQQALLQQRI
jgi:hypothetical protein